MQVHDARLRPEPVVNFGVEVLQASNTGRQDEQQGGRQASRQANTSLSLEAHSGA